MAYLVKPFTKADLIPAIEIAVSRFAEVGALQKEVTNLRDRLEMRKLLDRAKGVLQAARGVTEPEAFRWIQKTSMDRRMTMRALAQEVLDEYLRATAAEKAKPDDTPAKPGGESAGPEPSGEPAKPAEPDAASAKPDGADGQAAADDPSA